MVKKIALVAVSAALLSSLLGSAAQAAGSTTIEFREEAGITWADASSQGGSVRVVFLTPKTEKGRRHVWQACRFSSTLAGTYQCGIDTSSGSLAAKREGAWLVKVFVNGELGSKARFSL